MNQLFKYSLGLLVVIMMYGCEKDESDTAVVVDSRLQPYFDRFAEEGATRGVTVDYFAEPIEGKIEDIEGNSNVAGQCQSNSAKADALLVDTGFWNNASDIEKEFVIFHELGHCYLDRDHLDTENNDGSCSSMMHSGSSGCTNNYDSNTRSEFLDELFNP